MSDSDKAGQLRLWYANGDQEHLDSYLREEQRSWKGPEDRICVELQTTPHGSYQKVKERLRVLDDCLRAVGSGFSGWRDRETGEWYGGEQIGWHTSVTAEVRVIEGLFDCFLAERGPHWKPILFGEVPEYLQDLVSDVAVRAEGVSFLSIITEKKY